MLRESVDYLGLGPGAVVLDGTLGGGGHAAAILERTGPDGILIGLDLDEDARIAAGAALERYGDRVHIVRASFRNLDAAASKLGFQEVDAVLLDLGVSSHQLDSRERGFRFGDAEEAKIPLDMRMDRSTGPSAAELLQTASVDEMARWFREYGELRGAGRLAHNIAEGREQQPFRTTADLVRVVRDSRVGGGRRHNPATLVFQALRIAVNDELAALEQGLDATVTLLRPGGRLVVIAYHSLEDRIVKHHIRAAAKGCTCPPQIPVCVCGGRITLRPISKRALAATPEEIAANPRARSARLRAAERVEGQAA